MDNNIDEITCSVSTVNLSPNNAGDAALNANHNNSVKIAGKLVNKSSIQAANSSNLNTYTGNLNLPHVAKLNKLDAGDLQSSSQNSVPVVGRVNRDYSLEHFEILSTIGTGTFGRVMLVKEKHTKEYFALKVMKIFDVIKLKQSQHVISEKAILSRTQHPFIVQLFWTYHDDSFLYMLLEFACGGELFSYLRNAGRFNNSTSLFFACEIVSALEYLHSLHIVYRDLKPENLLLDRDGHTKITDFGFAKVVEDRTWTLCGTPEYLAPEVIQSKGHGKSVDWWALGILIYEMLAGFPPFWDESPFGIYKKILEGRIEFPKTMDLHGKDLIKKLLVADRTRRLGNMKNGVADIKSHSWFKKVNWDAVVEKKTIPPIVPRVRHSGDTRNFDNYPEDNWKQTGNVSPKDVSAFESF